MQYAKPSQGRRASNPLGKRWSNRHRHLPENLHPDLVTFSCNTQSIPAKKCLYQNTNFLGICSRRFNHRLPNSYSNSKDLGTARKMHRRMEGVEVSSSFHPALSYRFRTFPRLGHGLGRRKTKRFGSVLICLKSERKCRFLDEIGTFVVAGEGFEYAQVLPI